MRTRRALLVALLGLAAGLAGPAAAPPVVLDLQVGGERLRLDPAELAARVPLAAGEDFRVAELARDAHSSHHVVAIRTAEIPHRHDRHDLQVVMLRGHGSWRVGERSEPVGEGSVLYVPRGTLHAFSNQASEPALAYAVYTPAFEGSDRVEVPDPEP